MHAKIKEMLNTSSVLNGYLMTAQKPNAFNDQGNPKYVSHFGRNSYAGSKMHSKIKERLNTFVILKRIPLPIDALNAFGNQNNYKYVFNFGWNSYADSQIK
jgi:hypothetical protein